MSTTNNRLTAEELQKLRQTDFSKKQGFVRPKRYSAKRLARSALRNGRSSMQRLVHGIMAKCCGSGAKNSV